MDNTQNTLLSPSLSPVARKTTVRGRPAPPGGPRLRKQTSKPTLSAEFTANVSPSRPSSSVEPSPVLGPIAESQLPVYQPHARVSTEKGIQTNPTPHSGTATGAGVTAATKRQIQVTLLPVSPPVKFEAPPLSIKALPIEVAQWTFTQDQMQQIVSRAIRQSGEESRIRLLSLDALDVEIPREEARLEGTRAQCHAQYRFMVHRRTMLLQSLNAYACAHSTNEDGMLTSLVSQLATLMINMDLTTQALLHACAHQGELAYLRMQHGYSALSMALRKLNGSYAKRTAELKESRKRLGELEAELEEAWRCAEEMAREGDDTDGEEVDGETEYGGAMADQDTAEVMDITGKAVFTQATLTTTTTVEREVRTQTTTMTRTSSSAAAAARSRTENRLSGISTDTAGSDRVSRVTAARKRSMRASKASLRLPKYVVQEISANTNSPPIASNEERVHVHRRKSRSRSRSQSRVRGRRDSDPVFMLPSPPPVPTLPRELDWDLGVGACVKEGKELEKGKGKEKCKGKVKDEDRGEEISFFDIEDVSRRGRKSKELSVVDVLIGSRGRDDAFRPSSHAHPSFSRKRADTETSVAAPRIPESDSESDADNEKSPLSPSPLAPSQHLLPLVLPPSEPLLPAFLTDPESIVLPSDGEVDAHSTLASSLQAHAHSYSQSEYEERDHLSDLSPSGGSTSGQLHTRGMSYPPIRANSESRASSVRYSGSGGSGSSRSIHKRTLSDYFRMRPKRPHSIAWPGKDKEDAPCGN